VINITYYIKCENLNEFFILLIYRCILLKASIDQEDWIRVVDHTEYFCRSWQYLYFKPRVVLYIRIVGTNNTVNKVSFLG